MNIYYILYADLLLIYSSTSLWRSDYITTLSPNLGYRSVMNPKLHKSSGVHHSVPLAPYIGFGAGQSRLVTHTLRRGPLERGEWEGMAAGSMHACMDGEAQRETYLG